MFTVILQIVVVGAVSLLLYFLVDRFGKQLLKAALLKEKTVFASRHHTLSTQDTQRIETITGVVNKIGRGLIVIGALGAILSLLGVQLEPILAGAGIVGIFLGFGLQSLVKDIVGGILIVFENQFVKGDIIRVGNVLGEVTDISLRFTVIRDREGVQHYLPNGQMAVVSNYTKSWANVIVTVPFKGSVVYDKATTVLQKVIDEFYHDSAWANFFLEQPKVAGIERFDNAAVVLVVTGKVIAQQRWHLERELRLRIKLACEASTLPLCE